MATNDPKRVGASGALVTVTDWNACYNSQDGQIALSCTVTAADSSAGITGVGLILNNSKGVTLASFYTELSNGSESVTPALNMPPGGLAVGSVVSAVVSGEVEGQHYFFEKELKITNC